MTPPNRTHSTTPEDRARLVEEFRRTLHDAFAPARELTQTPGTVYTRETALRADSVSTRERAYLAAGELQGIGGGLPTPRVPSRATPEPTLHSQPQADSLEFNISRILTRAGGDALVHRRFRTLTASRDSRVPGATPQHRQWASAQRDVAQQARRQRRGASTTASLNCDEVIADAALGLTPGPGESAPVLSRGRRAGSRSTRLGHIPRDTRSLEELMRGMGRRPHRQASSTGPQPGLHLTYRLMPGEGFGPAITARREVTPSSTPPASRRLRGGR